MSDFERRLEQVERCIIKLDLDLLKLKSFLGFIHEEKAVFLPEHGVVSMRDKERLEVIEEIKYRLDILEKGKSK
jgi:hypothetical protein